MMHRLLHVLWLLALVSTAAAQGTPPADTVSTREIENINWMEFREVVPSKIRAVLWPTGTIEAHGVENNGADVTAPLAIARHIARRVNALVAPALPYGITGSLVNYPGGFQIGEATYRAFVRDVLEGMVKNGFRSIIVINGHGGSQGSALSTVAAEISSERRVRTLVVNWWTFTSDVTKEVFGEDGGHAGWNETAFIQAINPGLVHPERYTPDLATPLPPPGSWSAAPFPSSIMLYQPGQGYPRFDQKKAEEYFNKVTDKVADLILEVIRKWDLAGL